LAVAVAVAARLKDRTAQAVAGVLEVRYLLLAVLRLLADLLEAITEPPAGAVVVPVPVPQDQTTQDQAGATVAQESLPRSLDHLSPMQVVAVAAGAALLVAQVAVETVAMVEPVSLVPLTLAVAVVVLVPQLAALAAAGSLLFVLLSVAPLLV
jgi:hypothetical protein